MDETLKILDFVYDGITITSPEFLECIDSPDDYNFPRYRSGQVKSISCPQYVHRSGAIFIRRIMDRNGKVILVGIENYRHASNENKFREITRKVVEELMVTISQSEDKESRK